MNDFNDDNYCFACGKDNPMGLHLNFKYDDKGDYIYAKTPFSKSFQGWKNVLHGGIISVVLDEVMIKAAHHKGYKCATVELTVRFRRPVFLDRVYTIKGMFKAQRKKIVIAEGSLYDEEGITYATASGRFFLLPNS